MSWREDVPIWAEEMLYLEIISLLFWAKFEWELSATFLQSLYLSVSGISEELHTDSIDGGHEANYGLGHVPGRRRTPTNCIRGKWSAVTG